LGQRSWRYYCVFRGDAAVGIAGDLGAPLLQPAVVSGAEENELATDATHHPFTDEFVAEGSDEIPRTAFVVRVDVGRPVLEIEGVGNRRYRRDVGSLYHDVCASFG
jgi:hypothetical protein